MGELDLPELPDGGAHPGVVVIIHGAYWRSQYGAELGEPLAGVVAVWAAGSAIQISSLTANA